MSLRNVFKTVCTSRAFFPLELRIYNQRFFINKCIVLLFVSADTLSTIRSSKKKDSICIDKRSPVIFVFKEYIRC